MTTHKLPGHDVPKLHELAQMYSYAPSATWCVVHYTNQQIEKGTDLLYSLVLSHWPASVSVSMVCFVIQMM